MFSNCILREEDKYKCPGKTDRNCKACPYYYRGSLSIRILGFFIGFLFIVSLIIGFIVASPFILLAILCEALDA